MRKLTADFILSPNGELVRNNMLLISETGKILDLIEGATEDVEYFPGILSPGFINTHCHLELSHLKNRISRGTRLQGFIEEIVRVRRSEKSEPFAEIEAADKFMWENGIQAVGDICNNNLTFAIKENSKIRYHSFIEIFNMASAEAEITFKKGLDLLNEAHNANLNASLVPHAPYSSSNKLFELIQQYHNLNPSCWSIHNQESLYELELFESGNGKLFELFSKMGNDMSSFVPTGLSSLISMTNFFPSTSNLLLVHNTYTGINDLLYLKKNNFFERGWFSICGKANLFIEELLPDLNLLVEQNCKITIGTDSLASNDSLSVLDELKVIQNAFPTLKTNELLTFATKNGAQYFRWEDLGSFKKNTSPGIIQITDADSEHFGVDSHVIRII